MLDDGRDGTISDILSGVILHEDTKQVVTSLCASMFNAKQERRPLRNCILHGPPGTGKTLLAKRISQNCGFHFAMVSGGDLAALGAKGVPELHRLFAWA